MSPRPPGEPILRIVLIGMMGSGKSTVGRLVAERLGWRYVDNDQDVHTLTRHDAPEVIAAAGESTLHEAEAEAFLRALSITEPIVLSAAAWVVLDDACASAIERERWVAYLRARPATLRERIGSGAGRRSDATDPSWLEQRFDERDAIYARLATVTVDGDELTPAETAAAVLAALGH
jgi:shikimate kinase